MYEDEPSDKVHDVLADAVFGDHPLGRPVIGKAEVIAGVPVPDIAAYRDQHYVSSNLVVAGAGSIEHAPAGGAGAGHAGRPRRRGRARRWPTAPPIPADPRLCFHAKETEQYHLALGAPGLARGDERRFALRVLDTILGGSSSSRLFQEVREKRGLAYAVYSFASQFIDSGQVGLYVGTRPDNVDEAMKVIGDELRRVAAEGVTEAELERARENVKGRTTLAMESTLARMNRLGSSLLTGVPLLSLDEVLARVDAVTLEDVASWPPSCSTRRGCPRPGWGPARTSSAAPSAR